MGQGVPKIGGTFFWGYSAQVSGFRVQAFRIAGVGLRARG